MSPPLPAPADPAGGTVSMGPALLLVGTIALLLGVFVVGVILLTRSHRRRLSRSGPKGTRIEPDPWQEAGRRLSAPDSEEPGGR